MAPFPIRLDVSLASDTATSLSFFSKVISPFRSMAKVAFEATFDKLRKSPLKPVHCHTRPALLQHIRDCGLNRCGASHRRTSGSPGPSSRCFRRTTAAGEPAVLNGFYGAMELALELLDLTTSTFSRVRRIRAFGCFCLTCVSHFECNSLPWMCARRYRLKYDNTAKGVHVGERNRNSR